MFLVSGPQLLTACCRAGILGSLPAPNARTLEQLDQWLGQIAGELAEVRQTGGPVAPPGCST
ncbi:hypothetical protein ACFS3C_21515 [Azotobacter vinelandii]